MYNCEDIFEKTDACLDGELSELEYAEFEKHLESCEACRNSVEFAKKLNGVMHGMPSVEPPADFLDNLHKKIATEGKVVRFYKKWQPYGALAACLVLAVVIRTNAVRDLNESSSYLKMATPEPTVAETVNEEAYTAVDTATLEQDIADTETIADTLGEVTPTVAPTARVVVPEITSVPTQTEQPTMTEAVTKTDYVQPTAEAVQMPEAVASEDTAENAVPLADVPMMLSLREEDMASVAPTEEAAPEAAAPMAQTNSAELNIGESAVATADASVTSTSSATTSSKRVSGGGSGGGSSGASSGGGGGSASTGGTVISGITSANTPSMVNYINAEHKSDVEALIASLGIQKSGAIYTASKAVFEQLKAALKDKDIPFDGIYMADGDNVRFGIEWE